MSPILQIIIWGGLSVIIISSVIVISSWIAEANEQINHQPEKDDE